MQTLSDLEAEAIAGGIGFTLPSIQISPNIIVNTIPQINAGSSLALFGGKANLNQQNGTFLFNNLFALLRTPYNAAS
ncbi:MAG: hypothetical protein RLZZ106_1667 [Cyanobacteriota bacterium]|jgi:hypothetical protein